MSALVYFLMLFRFRTGFLGDVIVGDGDGFVAARDVPGEGGGVNASSLIKHP